MVVALPAPLLVLLVLLQEQDLFLPAID